MLPKKIVPKFVVNDGQASSHDNGELISSKYQDETEEASSRPSKIKVDIFKSFSIIRVGPSVCPSVRPR